MSQVTGIMTSCIRPDLLERTLDSFYKENTYSLKHLYIIDDSGVTDCNDHVIENKPYRDNIILLYHKKRRGQIEAIDNAYSYVDTPYIFHMEEDWQFLRGGFIEKSMALLEDDYRILMCWLLGTEKRHHHPYRPEVHETAGVKYRHLICPWNNWNGFTFNPTLRRLSDYQRFAPFAQHTKFHPGKASESEKAIDGLYKKDYYSVILEGAPYIKHIGGGRHIKLPL